MHDVGTEVGHRLVGGEHVTQLAGAPADAETQALGEERCARNRTGAVARCEQQHIVAGVLQPTGQGVEHGFRAAVCRGWDRDPGGSDDADPHACAFRQTSGSG